MRDQKSLGFWAVLICVLSFTSSCENTPTPKTLSIFHTNDLHSHLFPDAADPFKLGGFARLATLLRNLRAQNPTSVTLDAGDWSEGTWFYNVDGGANILRALDLMGYTATVFGNHDYLNGPDAMLSALDTSQPSYPVMAANFDLSHYSRASEFESKVPKSKIITVDGLKIGVIGLTCYELLYNSYVAPLVLLNPIEEAGRVAAELRSQVDVLIVVSHNAFETNVQLAKAVLGVDAVISGHSHKRVSQAFLVQNAGKSVPVVETGEWGKFVGDLQLEVDAKNKKVSFKHYQLHAVDGALAEAPDLAAFAAEQQEKLKAKFGIDPQEIVAESDFEITRADAQESPLGNLAVKAYLHAVNADLAMEQISLTGVNLPKGKITAAQLHDVMPHIYNPQTGREWELVVWNGTGRDIQKLAQALYTISGLMPMTSPLGWLSMEPAQIDWTLKAGVPPKSEIVFRTIAGQEFDPARRYRVVMSEGFFDAIKQADSLAHIGLDLGSVSHTDKQASDSIIEYGRQVQVFKKADLSIGKKFRVAGSNLGIYPYGIEFDHSVKALRVSVQGRGTELASGATLICSYGLMNDPVLWGTDQQKWTEVGRANLLSMADQDLQMLTLPWPEGQWIAGLWPVRCEVQGGGDQYIGDDRAERILEVVKNP